MLRPVSVVFFSLPHGGVQHQIRTYGEAVELPPHRLTMLRRFFQDYKQLEGKSVEVDEFQPAEVAMPVIEDALQRYSRHRRKGFH